MKRLQNAAVPGTSLTFLMMLLLGLSMAAVSHEVHEKIPNPGYRPNSEHMTGFLDAIDTATVAVLPTIVQRQDRSVHWFASQQQLIAELNEHNIGSAHSKRLRLDRGPVAARSQWQIFEATLEAVAEVVRGKEIDADYIILLEILVPTGQSVFGIEVYIVDREGRNAFSFLLNSHHQVFADANLVAADTTEAARTAMIEAATQLAATALVAQIDQARECASTMTSIPFKPEAGVLDDFESDLVSGLDANGISLGFVTFGDEATSVRIATTAEYPPKAGDATGNSVLQLKLDVASWGGMARTYTNPTIDEWTPIDWSEFDGLSFWLHGSASGTTLYIHIMDNRHSCSTVEDAERYGAEFTDYFSGWQQVSFRFAELERIEVWNGAPDDGLGLTRVHGWALGSGKTARPLTIYVDDFGLWQGEPD